MVGHHGSMGRPPRPDSPHRRVSPGAAAGAESVNGGSAARTRWNLSPVDDSSYQHQLGSPTYSASTVIMYNQIDHLQLVIELTMIHNQLTMIHNQLTELVINQAGLCSADFQPCHLHDKHVTETAKPQTQPKWMISGAQNFI